MSKPQPPKQRLLSFVKNFFNFITNFSMRRLVIFLISLYQGTLSPDHGPSRVKYPHGFCRFYPTCSEYTKQSVQRFGVGRGLWLGATRLVRCHPWSEGGIDKVPTT